MDRTAQLHRALRQDPKCARRAARAARTRAAAFAPGRLLLRLALLPVTTVAVTVSIYTTTRPFERDDSLRHLVALGGCEAAASVGLAHMSEGEPGYHPVHDPDDNGIACEDPMLALLDTSAPPTEPTTAPGAAGTAKFIRP